MAAAAAPYGARPVGTLSASGSFTGKVRKRLVASAFATATYYGDFIKGITAGLVEKDTGTTALTPIGIFVGCEYTDPNSSQKVYSNYYPGAVTASDIRFHYVEDPHVLFQMQADGTIAQTALGANFAVVQTAGNSSLGGPSKNAVDADSVATTAALPLRLVDFVDGPDASVGDAFTDLIVAFNTGHQILNTTGTSVS